jgi:hypothetical protein
MAAKRKSETFAPASEGNKSIPKMFMGHAFPTWGEFGMEFHSDFWNEDRYAAYVDFLARCRTILSKMAQSDPGGWKSVLRLCGDSWKKDKNLDQKTATIEWVVHRPVILSRLVEQRILPEFTYSEQTKSKGADT